MFKTRKGAATLHHAPVGRVRDGVDVRGHLVSLLALVHVDDLLGVDGQVLVGVDHHAEEPRVRLQGKGGASVGGGGVVEGRRTWTWMLSPRRSRR